MKFFVSQVFIFISIFGFNTNVAHSQDTAVVNRTINNPVIQNSNADTVKYALLYVYRPRNYVGSLVNYDIHVGDSTVGNIKNNSKFVVKLYNEGTTTFWAKSEQKRIINVTVKFGQEYFLKCAVTTGILVGRPEINLVYPDQGRLDFESIEVKKSKKNK